MQEKKNAWQGGDKKGKDNKSLKKAKALRVSFSITRNVTADNGNRDIYVRITTPTGEVLSGGGSFAYENRQLAATMKKTVEYTGQETPVSMVKTDVGILIAGTYHVSIFADGNMIGSRNITFEK